MDGMSKKGIVFIGGLAVMALTVLNASAQSLRFSRFEAKVEKVRNIKVDLSTRNARMFRTNLRNAAKEGVNFAGHYVLTGWGCGTNCSEWAIIDARNGKVFFPRELEGVGGGLCDLPDGKTKYAAIGSRLLLKNHLHTDSNKERSRIIAENIVIDHKFNHAVVLGLDHDG